MYFKTGTRNSKSIVLGPIPLRSFPVVMSTSGPTKRKTLGAKGRQFFLKRYVFAWFSGRVFVDGEMVNLISKTEQAGSATIAML